MKTIAFNGNRNWVRVFFVLAALGGLYYLRRQGKSVSDVLAVGTNGMKQAREFFGQVAPPLAQVKSAARSVPTSARI